MKRTAATPKPPARKKSARRPPSIAAPFAVEDANALAPLFGPPRHLVFAAAAMFLAVLFLFGDLIFNGGDNILSNFGTDLSFSFVQYTQFALDQVLHHHNLPLWNPHQYSGAPFLGGFQSALLYPPNWIHLVLPTAQAFNAEIIGHVFLAGVFTYAWMAHRGLHPVAAAMAGFVFMFSGGYFVHITAGHLPNLRTMAWAPLIFLAIDDLTMTRSLRGAWLGAGAVALSILGGHVQYVYYTALLAMPYALLCLRTAPSIRRSLIGLLLMGVGAVGLCAVQLFTGLDNAAESERSKLTYAMAHTFPLPPENLLTLFAPNIYGSAGSTMAYWGRWYYWEASLFIGSVALAMAVYGALRGESRFRRFSIVMVVASLLIALGLYTPIYGVLFKVVPGFGSFRGVSKCAYLGVLFLAALSGVGLDRILRAQWKSNFGPYLTGGLALAIIAGGIAIADSGRQGSDGRWAQIIRGIDWSDEGRLYGPYGFIGPQARNFPAWSSQLVATELYIAGVGALLAAVGWFLSRRWPKAGYVIPAVALLQLLNFAHNNRPTFPLSQVTSFEAPIAAAIAQVNPEDRVSTGVPCITLGAGGNDVWGGDPMVLRRYARFMTYHQAAPTDALIQQSASFYRSAPTGSGRLATPTYDSPLWGMVRLRLMWLGVRNSVSTLVNGRLVEVGSGSSGRRIPTLLNGPQLPRALLVEKAQILDDPEKALPAMIESSFDPRRQVLLESTPRAFTPASAPAGDASPPGSVKVADINSDTVEVTADVARPSILLFSDNFARGWRATPLDAGNSPQYEVLPADYTLLAVPLPAGHHHFSLVYRPTSFVIGKWVTIVSLIVYVLLAFRPWGRRRMSTK